MNKSFFAEAIKYGIVGIMNTLLTALTIWLMMYFIFKAQGEDEVSSVAISVSNIVGYVVGVINSFVWNRNWTFKSNSNWKTDFLKFVAAFLICYIPQLLLVNALNNYANLSPIELTFLNHSYLVTSAYICQLIGIIFYTILNFLLNKYYTFKR